MIGSYKLNFKNLSKVIVLSLNYPLSFVYMIHKTENAGKTTQRPGNGKSLEGSTNDRQVRFFIIFLQAESYKLDILFLHFIDEAPLAEGKG